MGLHVDKYRIRRDISVKINTRSTVILHPSTSHGTTNIAGVEYYFYLPIYEGRDVDEMSVKLCIPFTGHVEIEVVVSKTDVQKAIDGVFAKDQP